VSGEWLELVVSWQNCWDELLDRYLGAAQKELPTEDFEREWKKGRATSFEEAVHMALTIG
jgi:hypothetical protein